MRIFRLYSAVIIAALLSACGGPGVSPSAIAPSDTTVSLQQSIVHSSSAGAPSITVKEYRLSGYTGGTTIAVTSDESIWTGTDQNSGGQQGVLRVHGKSTTFYPFNPAQPYPDSGGTTLLATSNGRVWSIGLDDYYASASTTQATLGPIVPHTNTSGYVWGPGTIGPDGNVWYSVYGAPMGYDGCNGPDCPPEYLVKVNQNANGGPPAMYKPPQYPNGNGTEPNVVAVGPDNDIWLGGTGMPNVTGGTGFDRYSTSGVLLGTVPMKMNYLMVAAVAGPDHNMWVLGGDDVFRVTPSGATTDYRVPTSNSGPSYITVGGDGALWFTEAVSGKLGRITTAGKITEYTIPNAGGQNNLVLGQIVRGFERNELWIGGGGYGRSAALVQVII